MVKLFKYGQQICSHLCQISSSPQPKWQMDLFGLFCSAHYCDRQTDRPTDHATQSVTIRHNYARSTATKPNNKPINLQQRVMPIQQ